MITYGFNLKKLLVASFFTLVLILAVASNVFAVQIYEVESANNSIGSATVITCTSIGQNLDATIGYGEDVDYFKFTPENSGGYSISVTSSNLPSLCASLHYNNLWVMDTLKLADNVDRLIGELKAGSTYYLKFSTSEIESGSYSFNIKFEHPDYDEVEPNNSLITASMLSFPSDSVYGKSVSASIEKEGDIDFYKFIPDADGNYTFESTGTSDVTGYLVDSNNNSICYDDNSGEGSNFKFTNRLYANQSYYLKVQNSVNLTGDYAIKILPSITAGTDTEGNSYSSAELISCSNGEYTTYKGAINTSLDRDYFKFTTGDSGYYTIKCNSLCQIYGDIYKRNQNGVYEIVYYSEEDNDIHNTKSEVILDANTTYYVELSAPTESTGNYTLDIIKGRLLNVPKFIQLPYNNLCWAACISMAVSCLNNDPSNHFLDIAKAQAITDGAGSNYIYPSYFNAGKRLIDGDTNLVGDNIRIYVPDTSTATYLNCDQSTSDYYYQGVPAKILTFEDVKNRIDNSYPIITLITWVGKDTGHVHILTGYFEKNGIQYVTFNDPLAKHGAEVSMPFTDYVSNTEWKLYNYTLLSKILPPVTIPDNTDYETDSSSGYPDNDTVKGSSMTSDTGATISGSIGVNGDSVDYYRIPSTSISKNITISVSGPEDTVISLYRITPSGLVLISESNDQSAINCPIGPTSMDHCVKVTNTTNSGNYTLNISYSMS